MELVQQNVPANMGFVAQCNLCAKNYFELYKVVQI